MAELEFQDIDLDRLSEQEIMELIKAGLERLEPMQLSEVIREVDQIRRAKESEVRESLLNEFRERAREMGLSLEAVVGGRQTRSDAGQSLTPKYRGPHGETWSGRGRQPRWLMELEATGHDREEFRIKKQSEE